MRRLLATGLVVLASGSAQAQAMADVEMVVHPVRGNISMIEGRGGNIGVLTGDDGVLIIDDQFAPLAEKIRAAVATLSDDPIEFLLNTHHHGDHTGANAHFGADTHIVAHTKVRDRLARSRGTKPEALPVVTFDETLTLHFNGQTIRMVHYGPGHTDNDSVVVFEESNVIHMGDLLFTGSFPSFYTNEGGDIRGYAQNVAAVIEMFDEDTRIIAGHGPLASPQDVRDFHAMLVGTTAVVQGYVDAGKSLDEAKEAGLPDQFHRWASSFTTVETWIAKVYRNLAD